MKSTDYIDQLLARHFANESLTDDQKIDIEEWRVQNQEIFDKLKMISTETSKVPDDVEFDSKKAWNKIEPNLFPKYKTMILSRYLTFGATAAAVLVMIVFGLSWYLQNETLTLQYANNTNKQHEIILPDQSIVKLYPGASIQYTGGKKRGNRSLSLKGQAFFDVKKLNDRPFNVRAYNTQINVIGTSFFVDAIANNYTDVKVKTGKVVVTSNDRNVILLANQQVVVTEDKMIKKVLDNTIETQELKQPILKFNKTPIEDVITTLEKNFNVKIKIDQSLKKNTITTVINTDNIEDIISELSYIIKCRYKKISNNNYILYID